MSRANEANTSRPMRRSVTSEGLVEGTAMLVLYVALSNAVASGSFAWDDLAFGLTIGPVIGALVGLAIALWRECQELSVSGRRPGSVITALSPASG